MDDQVTENKFKVGENPKIRIENARGSVTITTGKNKTVSVSTRTHMDSGNAERTTISVEQNEDGSLAIISKWDNVNGNSWKHNRPVKVDFVIEIPNKSDVRIRTVSAWVAISGMKADYDVKTVSGKITLDQITGELNFRTVSGRISGNALNGAGTFNTISGNVTLHNSELPSFRSKTVSGNMLIETAVGAGPYEFRSVSGNAKLITDKDAPLSIITKTLSGRLKTSLRTSHYSRKHGKTRASLNGGGVILSMKSVSGNLHVVSSDDDRDVTPLVEHLSGNERIEILTQLQNGDLSLDEASIRLS